MTKQEDLLKNGSELLIEALIVKCVDTYHLSDLHIRADQAVAIREHGEIIILPDDVVSGQEINKFLQKHLDTFHYEKLNKEMQLDTAFVIQGVRYRANIYESLNVTCMVLRKIETIIPPLNNNGDYEYLFNVNIYALSYNILTIANGMAGLIFI